MPRHSRHFCQSGCAEGARRVGRAEDAPGAAHNRVRALVAIGLVIAALSGVEPARAATPPERAAAPGPVLVELGGWEVFARRVQVGGAYLRFEAVQARRAAVGEAQTWRLAADRLDVALDAAGPQQLRWMRARGRVRLSGPHDFYVMADQAIALAGGGLAGAGLAGAGQWLLVGEFIRPSLLGDGWRLDAGAMTIDLNDAKVTMDDVGSSADNRE